MKKTIMLILILMIMGCAGRHYYHEDRSENGTVQFVLNGLEAEAVYFAYSLDNYQLHPTERTNDETWAIHVSGDKTFKYFYLVDGTVYIPPCTLRETDDFGSENCIYVPGM